MNKKLFITGLFFVFLFSFSQTGDISFDTYLKAYKKANKDYETAEKIANSKNYDEQKEEQLNKSALTQFSILCKNLTGKGGRFDSLLFHCYIKAGILFHYFDSIKTAREYYINGLQIQQKANGVNDSFRFKPLIYLGGIVYLANDFDSAKACYQEAETIAARYTVRLSESERLLNTLGALFYEAGNYSQAKNYFTKAINSVSLTGEAALTLTENYKINLAATLTKLEEYQEAEKIYESLLSSELYRNTVLHNLGFINYKIGNPNQALAYFRKVKYAGKSTIRLFNDMSQTFLDMDHKDSSKYYLELALKENRKWNQYQKNIQHGITLKYIGDLESQNENYMAALTNYQLAIIQFLPGFISTDPGINPQQYNGIFSYINLFHTLVAKAEVFEKIYEKEKNTETLSDALDAFHSAFNLAYYVERTYNSDEARLFLGRLKYTVRSKPVDISLQLYSLTSDKKYLEQAWQFDQRNKATVLLLGVHENEWKKSNVTDVQLLDKEATAVSVITRLSLKAQQISDSAALAEIDSKIRDAEISLGRIREELKRDPTYAKLDLYDNIPSLSELQKYLEINTGLISFHLSESYLIALFITKRDIEFYKLPTGKIFFDELMMFQAELQNSSPGQRYDGKNSGRNLYQKIISPFRSGLSQLKRLIIIPDNELSYIPFESLVDENNQYLVEKFSFTYQYASSFFKPFKNKSKTLGFLAMAPFSAKSYSTKSSLYFSRLESSLKEISNINGKKLLNSEATKQNFLSLSNQFGIIHLATHASINNQDPQASYIAFNPINEDFKLYSREISTLGLDSVRLVILSACETGKGKLIKGEGLMSLSRAFYYAGCPNIITSLWKAEDKTTAFLGNRLHHYLDEGFSYDIALQHSKIDLLNSTTIEPRYKTPDYWSHLVFIGNYESGETKNNWTWIALVIIITTAVYLIFKNKSAKKQV